MKAYSYSANGLVKSEHNDCVVRTLAVAFGINYKESHKFCKEYLNREDKQGVYFFEERIQSNRSTKYIQDNYKVKLSIVSCKLWDDTKQTWKNTWVRKFIQEHPQGTYIILGKGHAFTIKDGEVLDWAQLKNKVYREIEYAFKVEKSLFNIVWLP